MPKKKSAKQENAVQLLSRRPRRLRRNETIREAIAETNLSLAQLVRPMFVKEGREKKTEIKSMPGQQRFSVEELLREIELSLTGGVSAFALFPVVPPEKKDAAGKAALANDNLAVKTIRQIKKQFPECTLYADIALDPYTTHGHDGVLRDGKILNDESVALLVRQALLMSEAGADFVAPSDMMDGRVGAIRSALDANGYAETGILSYTAKYASSFYGPFREALSSTPKSGNKKTYQMDYRNKNEALIEAELDFSEGADILMVKPAGAYLDIIQLLRQNFAVPIAAYQVSGEYSMIKFAAQAGAIREEEAILESVFAIRRAGADLIFTYFANELLGLLRR